MEYNKFIQSSFAVIQQTHSGFLNIKIKSQYAQLKKKIDNVYIQLIAEKNKRQTKIQQWSFITMTELEKSQYGDSDDPELDSVQFQKKSFLTILEQTLIKFSPKLPLKLIEPENFYLRLTTDSKQLLPFLEESNCIIEVGEYEGLNFSCKVCLKVFHNQHSPSSQDYGGMDSQQQFEVLIDPEFEKQKKKSITNSEYKQRKKQQKNEIQNLIEYQSPLKKNVSKETQKKKQSQQLIVQEKKSKQENQMIQVSTKYVYVSECEDNKKHKIQALRSQIKQLKLQGQSLKQFLDSL